MTPPRVLVIGCGALGRELVALQRLAGGRWTLTCLPAIWHNTPEKIAGGVAAKLARAKGRFDAVFVAYGDCGTGGALDAVVAAARADGLAVSRIDGPHCYRFFMGAAAFDAMTDADPAIFFVTDYLVRHFDRLIIKGLGLDRFPQLLPVYFGNYSRLVYLAQSRDAALATKARAAAARRGLAFTGVDTGYGELADFIAGANRAASPQTLESGTAALARVT